MKIKDLNILDVASKYIKNLKRSGNTYFAKCPKHEDDTPSLAINSEKNIFKCFSCGASGGVVNFIMFIKNCSKEEAYAILANDFNVEIDSNITKKMISRKEIDKLNEVYKRCLVASKRGLKEVDYLKTRGLVESDFQTFDIGSGTAFSDILKAIEAKKYNEFETNLPFFLSFNGESMFKNRVIFPVEDNFGIANFVGRSIDINNKIRYLNGKESVFLGLKSVGHLLFNFINAKERLEENKNSVPLIVVEGIFDAINLHKLNPKISVVSTLGCLATTAQVELMLSISNNILIFYDGDIAGVKGAISLYKKIKEIDNSVKVNIVYNPTSKDPDELVKDGEIKDCKVFSMIDFVIKTDKLDDNIKTDLVFNNLVLEDCHTVSLSLIELANNLFLDYGIVKRMFKKFLSKHRLAFELTQELKANFIVSGLFHNEIYIRYRKVINKKMFEKRLQNIISILDDYYKINHIIDIKQIINSLNKDAKRSIESLAELDLHYDIKDLIVSFISEYDFDSDYNEN